MTKNAKRLTRYSFLALAAANILAFGVTMLSFLFSFSDWATYLTSFGLALLQDVIMIVSAVIAMLNFELISKKSWLICSLALSMTRFFYLLPYDFLYFEYNGYDTGESITLALVQSILEVALTFGIILLISFVAHSITSRIAHSGKQQPVAELTKRAPFDFSDRYAVAVFSMAAMVFIYNLITEIIDTVIYLVDYAGTYRTGEIIYIVFCYVFILISLLVAHSVGFLTKTVGAKYILKESDDTQ